MGIAQESKAQPSSTGNHNFGALDAGQSSNAVTFIIGNTRSAGLYKLEKYI